MGRSDVRRAYATSLALEAEVNKEKASGLGRTAQQLEAKLAECARLRGELARASGALRTLLLEEYAEHRRQSEQFRWYLCIQREAVGVRRHDDVDAMFPRPPALKE